MGNYGRIYVRSGYYQPKKKKKTDFLIFFSIIVGLVVLTAGFTSTLPYFYVKNIQVEGLNRLKASEILQEVKILPNTSIFYLNVDKIFNKIKSKPLVKEVKIKRKLPSTLIIKITERVPFAYVKKNGKVWEIDEEGIVLKVAEDKESFPLISGIDPFKEKKKLLEIVEVIKFSQNLESQFRIKKVKFEKTDEGAVAYLENGLRVILGNCENYVYLFYIPSILKDASYRGEKFTCVDLRFDNQIVASEK